MEVEIPLKDPGSGLSRQIRLLKFELGRKDQGLGVSDSARRFRVFEFPAIGLDRAWV